MHSKDTGSYKSSMKWIIAYKGACVITAATSNRLKLPRVANTGREMGKYLKIKGTKVKPNDKMNEWRTKCLSHEVLNTRDMTGLCQLLST